MAQGKVREEAPRAAASGKGDVHERQRMRLDSGGSENSPSALGTDPAATPGSSHLPHLQEDRSGTGLHGGWNGEPGRRREGKRLHEKDVGPAGPQSSPHQGLLPLEPGDLGTGLGWGGFKPQSPREQSLGQGGEDIEVTGLRGQRQEPRELRALTQVSPGDNYKEWVSGAGVGAVTRAGDVLHQGADQGLPAGLAQRLRGLFIREEAICKILLVTQNPIQSGDKECLVKD